MLWGRRAKLISVGLAALIAMAEIDRVLGSIVTEEGRTATLSAITGFLSFPNIPGWTVWTADGNGRRSPVASSCTR